MRPKFLEIEGLQSFRDIQRIDFETLGELGLFGIFGPTGSGKSTILDAITFALYGKVKRADGGTQGIINANMNTAKVAFTFELVRGGNRKTFRVERVYQRKKGTVNSCEPKIARLIEITDAGQIPVCDKATDVSNHVKELLGLSHEDFTRAVVLPQNSFHEFLLLSNSDRRKMLERIFYLEEYGKQLQEKLNRKMARLKSRTDVLAGELKGYADATGEALEESKKALEDAVAERNRVEKELKSLESKYNEAKEVWNLVRELSFIEQREKQHLACGAEIAEKRVRLEKAVKADSLVEMIRKNTGLSEKLKGIEMQLNEVLGVLSGIADELNETRQKYETVKNEAATEQPKLVELRTRLVDALGIKEEVKKINDNINELRSYEDKLKIEITSKSEVIAKETGEIEELEQNLSGLKPEMESLKTDPGYRQQIQDGLQLENEIETRRRNIKDIEDKVSVLAGTVGGLELKLEQVRNDISLVQKSLEDLNGEKLEHEATKPEDKNAVLNYIEKLRSMQALFNVLSIRKSELDELESRIANSNTRLKELKQKAMLLNEEKEKANTVLQQCRTEFENANREKEQNIAWLLSKSLKDGEPCPVCGSTHHPNPYVHAEGSEPAVIEKRADQARDRLNDAERALKDAETAYLIAEEQVKSLAGQIEQAVQEFSGKAAEYEEEKRKLPEQLMNLEPEQIRLELERMNAAAIEKLNAIEAWEKKQEEYNKEVQKLNDIMSGYKLLENGVLSELKVNRENLEQLNKSLSDAKRIFDGMQNKYMDFLKHHKIESASSELARLSENDRRLNAMQKQMDQCQDLINNKRVNLEKRKEELRVLHTDSFKAETEINNLVMQKEDRENKLKGLAGDAGIEEEIRRIDEKLETYANLEKQYSEKLQVLEKRHNGLLTEKSLLMSQKEIYSENLKTEEDRLKKALIEKGFESINEVESSVISPEMQKALKDEIEEYDQSGTNIRAQKDMVMKKLNSRSITEEEWNRISSSYEELVLYKEKCASLSEVARNNFEKIKIKHDKWVELTNNYNGLKHKQDLYEQIQKLLRANSFIDFIAEERLRYVATRASEILGVMTKYKFALELDTDAGFIIRDNANGGVHRMVNSLSGGETFLTSLSLALALSEHVQLKGQSPLEFFFLDEGFGTLDNNLLDNVIDSLERLSRKERVIGLISHVPELRLRIARRLLVDPPTSQGNGSRVRIEKA